MKILKCSTIIPNSKLVNVIGKYLYKNLDGAFKIQNSSNMCDVYVTLLFQIPRDNQIPGKGKEYNDVHEITINLNITTYLDKIRINTLEMTPKQRTLGCNVYKCEIFKDLQCGTDIIMKNIFKKINKYYSEYEILF